MSLTHIFFDLDHTLWDYESNSRETLEEMYTQFELGKYFSGFEAFVRAFHFANDKLWHKYNNGHVDKEHIRVNRFQNIMKGRGEISEELPEILSEYFMSHCSRKSGLMDGTFEVLEYLSKKYALSVITNGFTDSQNLKIESAGIDKFFRHVVTSETANSRKPSKDIFDFALNISEEKEDEVLMIGDNFKTDIKGALNAGWDSIWYNPQSRRDFRFKSQIVDLL